MLLDAAIDVVVRSVGKPAERRSLLRRPAGPACPDPPRLTPPRLGWKRWGPKRLNSARDWSLCAFGQVKDGLALLTKGLSVIRATGTVLSVPFLLSLLADAHMRLGLPMEGLSCVAEAAQLIEVTGERREEAHLHRLRGDLLVATGDHMGANRATSGPSQFLDGRAQRCSSYAPPPASRGSGATRANGTRLASFSPQSTAGLPRASTRAI